MKLGIKDYISEWKITLFIIIQVVVALFWINGEVSILADEYHSLNCVESTEKGVYYYSNVLGVNGSIGDKETLDKTIDKIKGFKGYESVGFQTDAYCQVSGYKNKYAESEEIRNCNMNETLAKNVRLRVKSGSWFSDKVMDDEKYQVIIGGGLAKKYKVGDKLDIKYDNGLSKSALIVGSFGENYSVFDFSGYSALGNYVNTYLNGMGKETDIILSAEKSWFNDFGEDADYPSMSLMLKTKAGTDVSQYTKYGVVTSFDKVTQNTKKRCKEYLYNAVTGNGIWILILIFAVFGTAHISAKTKQYRFGVYSFLGMSSGAILRNVLIQNAVTYAVAMVLALSLKPCLEKFLQNSYEMRVENLAVTAIIIIVMFFASFISNYYVVKIEPKQIMTMSKE